MGYTTDLGVEHLIGEAAHVHFIFALPDKGCLVAAANENVAVDAVEGRVELCAGEPAVLVPFLVGF